MYPFNTDSFPSDSLSPKLVEFTDVELTYRELMGTRDMTARLFKFSGFLTRRMCYLLKSKLIFNHSEKCIVKIRMVRESFLEGRSFKLPLEDHRDKDY